MARRRKQTVLDHHEVKRLIEGPSPFTRKYMRDVDQDELLDRVRAAKKQAKNWEAFWRLMLKVGAEMAYKAGALRGVGR